MIRPGELLEFYSSDMEVRCRVEKVAKDGSFFSVVENANTLRIGKTMGMSITRPNGVEKAEGVVVKMRPYSDNKADNAPDKGRLEYLIKITKPFERVQKRKHFRHDCYIPAILNEPGSTTLYEGHILNISAGGAKLHANYHFKLNKVINITTTFGGKSKNLSGLVLSIDETHNTSKGYPYAIRVKFTEVSDEDEEDIVKFIFSEYRKSANKRASKDNKH